MPGSSLSQQVFSYANSRLGQRVGSGECFDLADLALRAVGARTASDYGTITLNADYVWGRLVNQQVTVSGDVIQFRNYRMIITTVTRTTQRNGAWTEETRTQTQTRPHHTAIVASIGQNGAIDVLEQNIGTGVNRRKVQRNTLYFGSPARTTSSTTQGGATTVVTTTMQVSGTARFYRAEEK